MTQGRDPFDNLEAGDGFRIKQVEYPAGNPTSVSLHVCAYAKGELRNLFCSDDPEEATVEIKEWKDPTPADMGACNRLQLALDAIARYLNTGGSWEELATAVEVMKRLAAAGLRFPGYHLLESVSNTEGDYEHLFVRDGTTDCVLWVEDQFIDHKTLDQVRSEREEDLWPGFDGVISVPKKGQPGEPDSSRLLALANPDDETANPSKSDG